MQDSLTASLLGRQAVVRSLQKLLQSLARVFKETFVHVASQGSVQQTVTTEAVG
jgi:hypothetical protein